MSILNIRRLFSSSSSPACGDFSMPLLLSMLTFNNRLQDADTTRFSVCIMEAAFMFFFGCMGGFIFGAFFRYFFKPSLKEIETKRQEHGQRRKVGYFFVARELIFEGIKINFLVMTLLFFMRSGNSHFNYGHYLIAGVLSALTASIFHTLSLIISDRLQRSSSLPVS